ncbi:2-amino-4-hydroxy-6-hydroxymethyldihydropteridine diphosphokinase [Sphingobium amiense]|uniref:2-amino-4-hydroxy-6-hydroxymethyldihydropteridine pyrophosphokinase n=1 Tax=Sphingobium amiense TaxID=135719 RepID=A0A494W1F7_9SPHN|nr:2-amino-4-hydroxy-6-hydroxymethyldihydropteridine diphosphokinase [Sphingobium amiense]BBD97156.1 2-amino-4-hydroxy-6-hydroxymethyldihydropteridine diphosphokinase [Sphingobium amiense]
MAGKHHLYVLALGSNRAVSARLTPARLLREAAGLLGAQAEVVAMSPIIQTPPLGPSIRLYANAAIVVRSALSPPEMLCFARSVETALGRRRYRRWGARSMDIDIILWSGGRWRSRALTIPHPAWRERDFVLRPVEAVAPRWRDPWSGRTVRQCRAVLRKPKGATRG